MKLKKAFLFAVVIFVLLASAFFIFSPNHREKTLGAVLSPASWQHMATPGELSQAHAFLEQDCNACHTPGKGVEAVNCTVCHAADLAILQRQPTGFHADIGNCSACHREHRGRQAPMSAMDHSTLAGIGLRQLEGNANLTAESAQIGAWLKQAGGPAEIIRAHPPITAAEAMLDCRACHQNDDRHFGLFGTDCASCHATATWNLAEFRHPSATSMDCAQCHQAPPSHYMGHFNMISRKVAGKPRAEVSECYTCHQTTSWPDIKDVGWYKHH